MRLAEAAGDLANTKFFFHLLANTYIINLRYSHVTIIQKTPESFHRFRRFPSIYYAVNSDIFFLTTSPLGRRSSIVPSILKITLSNPNP